MKIHMKLIYYIDISCMIIREGYFTDINYGNNHNIPIYNINRHIKDIVLDKYIFYDKENAIKELKEYSNEKCKNNNSIINQLTKENNKLFEKLLNETI